MINWEDSLLAHHSFASHFPNRLDHVASEFNDASPWKVIYGKRGETEKGQLPVNMSGADLCRYNAADCKMTVLAWKRMQEDLAPEMHTYLHDKDLAEVCRRMGIDGIGVDIERRDALMIHLKRRAAALKGQMRSICGWPEFQPSKVADVRKALFRKLRAKWTVPTSTGLPSTSDAALEAITGTDTKAGDFCDLLLRWRVCWKIRSTYLKVVEVTPGTFRCSYNWKPFGTVSGRLSCRFQSLPKYSSKTPEERVREIYIPAKGNVFEYYDVKQAEMKLAAWMSADPVFMAACAVDVHAGNAKIVFPEIAAKGWLDDPAAIKDPARGKPFRDICKNLGFAISYYAEAERAYITLRRKGFNVTFRAVELMIMRIRAGYWKYFRWVESNHAFVQKQGFMRTPLLGRIRWLGWYPKITEVANFPIQSALADIMNRRMILLSQRLPRSARLVAQIHDACIYDVPRREAPLVKRLIAEVWAEPVVLAGGPLELTVDQKTGERMSDL